MCFRSGPRALRAMPQPCNGIAIAVLHGFEPQLIIRFKRELGGSPVANRPGDGACRGHFCCLEVDGARGPRRIACRPARSARLSRSTRSASPPCDAGQAGRDLAPEPQVNDIVAEVDGQES